MKMPDELFVRPDRRYQESAGIFEVLIFATEEDSADFYHHDRVVLRAEGEMPCSSDIEPLVNLHSALGRAATAVQRLGWGQS